MNKYFSFESKRERGRERERERLEIPCRIDAPAHIRTDIAEISTDERITLVSLRNELFWWSKVFRFTLVRISRIIGIHRTESFENLHRWIVDQCGKDVSCFTATPHIDLVGDTLLPLVVRTARVLHQKSNILQVFRSVVNKLRRGEKITKTGGTIVGGQFYLVDYA